MVSKKDKAALTLLRMGKPKGLQILFESYFDEVCRYTYILIGDEETTKDIVQQIFVDLWENRQSLYIHTSCKSYLYTTAKNRSLNHIRKQHRMLSFEVIETEHKHGNEHELENIIDAKELDQMLKQSIESLPPQCREIFRLKIEENLSYRKIAQQLSLSEKTIENQMGIAYKKLRLLLKPVFDQLLLWFF